MRYYFHVHNGNGLTRDEEGIELADIDAARNKAVLGIRSIVSEEVMTGEISLAGRIDIAQGDGMVVATILFSDAVNVIGIDPA